jgi:hypothetical protein
MPSSFADDDAQEEHQEGGLLDNFSNVTAGTREQIQAVYETGLVSPLVHLLGHAEFDIKKEAAWAISNATSGGNA